MGRLAGHRPLHRLEPGVSFGPHEAWGRTWGEYQTRVRAAFSPMCPQGPGALETPASEHRGRRLRGRGLSPGQLQPAGNREAEPRLTGSPGAWRTLRDGAGATEGVAAGSVERTWGQQEPGLADVDAAGAERSGAWLGAPRPVAAEEGEERPGGRAGQGRGKAAGRGLRCWANSGAAAGAAEQDGAVGDAPEPGAGAGAVLGCSSTEVPWRLTVSPWRAWHRRVQWAQARSGRA